MILKDIRYVFIMDPVTCTILKMREEGTLRVLLTDTTECENGNQNRYDSDRTFLPHQIKGIKAAIAKATTFEEIERLNHMLRSGQVPGKDGKMPATQNGAQAYNPMEVEEDE